MRSQNTAESRRQGLWGRAKVVEFMFIMFGELTHPYSKRIAGGGAVALGLAFFSCRFVDWESGVLGEGRLTIGLGDLVIELAQHV